MENKLNILSIFDGIGGARQALKELNIDCQYYASEIDPFAIKVAMANHPDIKQLGGVKGLEIEDDWIFYNQDNDPMQNGGSFKADIDLLVAGFPCQSFSIAGNQKGFDDERGGLFFELLRILEAVKPKYFLFENVFSMSKKNKDIIDEKLGIKHICINSALLTAQQRKRIYWCGRLVNGKYEQVVIDQPKDAGIFLKDIIDKGYVDREKSLTITSRYFGTTKTSNQIVFNKPIRIGHFNKGGQADRVYSTEGKSVCLQGEAGGKGAKTGLYEIDGGIRKLSVQECEKLQGFPVGYCSSVSANQSYKCLGNSFTLPVIKHIISNLK
jgi:DNA-cytosine methyltransferase